MSKFIQLEHSINGKVYVLQCCIFRLLKESFVNVSINQSINFFYSRRAGSDISQVSIDSIGQVMGRRDDESTDSEEDEHMDEARVIAAARKSSGNKVRKRRNIEQLSTLLSLVQIIMYFSS